MLVSSPSQKRLEKAEAALRRGQREKTRHYKGMSSRIAHKKRVKKRMGR